MFVLSIAPCAHSRPLQTQTCSGVWFDQIDECECLLLVDWHPVDAVHSVYPGALDGDRGGPGEARRTERLGVAARGGVANLNPPLGDVLQGQSLHQMGGLRMTESYLGLSHHGTAEEEEKLGDSPYGGTGVREPTFGEVARRHRRAPSRDWHDEGHHGLADIPTPQRTGRVDPSAGFIPPRRVSTIVRTFSHAYGRPISRLCLPSRPTCSSGRRWGDQLSGLPPVAAR